MNWKFWKREKRSQNVDGDWIEVTPLAKSGVPISPRTALQCGAVYTCVKIITEAIASLPVFVYERLSDNSRRRADDHPLAKVLRENANEETTAFEFFEQMTADLLLWGNAFAEIQRNGYGDIVGLWRIVPEVVSVFRDTATEKIYYRLWTQRFGMLDLPSDRILHVKLLSDSGLLGMSPIEKARETIGLALASEEFYARFFQNSATPSGIITHPGVLPPEARQNLRETIQALYGGLSRAHRVALLEEGMKWETITMKPADAQFMDARKFQIEQIASLFRVPFHMLLATHPTYSSIEHFGIEFVNYCLRPQLVRWEQKLNNLLSDNFFVEFNLTGLLRGDLQSRFQAYRIARDGGWLSVNDIRRLENLPPLPDGGDIYLMPLNMSPLGTTRERSRFNFLLDDAIKKIVKREINDIKNLTSYDELVKYYNTKFSDNYDRLILSLYHAFADVLDGDISRAYDAKDIYCFEQMNNYKEIVNEDECFKNRLLRMKQLLIGERDAIPQ